MNGSDETNTENKINVTFFQVRFGWSWVIQKQSFKDSSDLHKIQITPSTKIYYSELKTCTDHFKLMWCTFTFSKTHWKYYTTTEIICRHLYSKSRSKTNWDSRDLTSYLLALLLTWMYKISAFVHKRGLCVRLELVGCVFKLQTTTLKRLLYAFLRSFEFRVLSILNCLQTFNALTLAWLDCIYYLSNLGLLFIFILSL